MVVLFGKLLVAQKFRVHALCGNRLGALGLFNAIGVSLVGIVVGARVFLLKRNWNV